MPDNTAPAKDSLNESPPQPPATPMPVANVVESSTPAVESPREVTADAESPVREQVPEAVSEDLTVDNADNVQVPEEMEEEPMEPPVPFEKYQDLQKQKDELFERFLRKQAEFENFRKRNDKEKQEFLDYALFQFVKELLPVLDSLERALIAPDGESLEDHKKGIELVLRQLRELLSSAGLQPIRSMGHLFDPHYHQAMLREESDRYAENEVIEEFQRGYIFKDRLLRPSMVKVAVAPTSALGPEKPVETKA